MQGVNLKKGHLQHKVVRLDSFHSNLQSTQPSDLVDSMLILATQDNAELLLFLAKTIRFFSGNLKRAMC